MVLLITEGKETVTRPILSDGDLKATRLMIDSSSFSRSLDTILKQDNLELVVIECHSNDRRCLPLISIIKKRRVDIPVMFVVSADTDLSISEAFKRGARDCFKDPFDLRTLKERVRTIRSLKKELRAPRVPMLAADAPHDDSLSVSSDLPESMVRVLNYLEEHLQEHDLSLEHLARIARMSIYHFCRSFKKYTAYSPMQYVTRMRVERAKKIMKYQSRRIAISQIATDVGFYDSSNLNRHFKKQTGLTPSEFIQSLHRH